MVDLRLYSLALACLISVSAEARAFVPDGRCAVIVASRQTLREVDDFTAKNQQIDFGPVFRSSNGWYAISAGMVDADSAPVHLRRLKSAGIIPNDSYCSEGSSYIAVARAAAGEADTAVHYGLTEDFDARPMSEAEKKFLQASLALSGDYRGLIDGVWGRGSQAALETYTWREFGREPTNSDAAFAILSAVIELQEGAWEPVNYPRFGISLYLPVGRISVEESTSQRSHVKDETKGIDVVIARDQFETIEHFHGEMVRGHSGSEPPYTLRNDELWVTGTTNGKLRNYARSHFDGNSGNWVSVWINWADWSTTQGLMISSISEGRGAWLNLPTESRSYEHVEKILAMIEEEGAAAPTTPPNGPDGAAVSSRPIPEPAPEATSSGTGFYVNANGSVLTNAHVVEECSQLLVDGEPATVDVRSEVFDLAVLSANALGPNEEWLRFARSPAGLNADITIAGYPLHGLLGGLNVTRGSVSSLKGLGGDEATIQISAPVQPGNSGGPVVNSAGEVVGVVVAKLDSLMVAEATGDIPQNVNFAIRGDMARAVLSANGVSFQTSASQSAVNSEELADKLQAATVLIECQ